MLVQYRSRPTTINREGDDFTMLVDSGSSGRFSDCDLIPGLEDYKWQITSIVTSSVFHSGWSAYASRQGRRYPARCCLGQQNMLARVKITCIVVPGPGRHLLSTGVAHARSVNTIISYGSRFEHQAFIVDLRQKKAFCISLP